MPAHGARLSNPRSVAAMGAVLSVAGIALSVTACSGSLAGTPSAAATSSAAAVPRGSYVALGDSYTAGPGIPDQVGLTAGCEQSSSSYPYLVAQRLRLHLTDMSCGSATIASLNTPQTAGDGTNPAQLNALSAATSLVTLGIGGNDVDWAAVRACTASPSGTTCSPCTPAAKALAPTSGPRSSAT
jgi:hypothetical protein